MVQGVPSGVGDEPGDLVGTTQLEVGCIDKIPELLHNRTGPKTPYGTSTPGPFANEGLDGLDGGG